ncbi:MAG: type II toxin-antitoxin system RelB/DinJ family antitoxin [Minisyncoccota bacterium]
MNTKTLLTIKTDKNLKKEAQKVAEELGIPLSTFINATLKQFVRNKEIALSVSYEPTIQLLKTIKNAREDYNMGNVSEVFTNITELKKRLNK